MESILRGRITDPPKIQFIDQAFRDQVRQHGDQVALLTRDAQLTYTELDTKSNQFASALKQKVAENTNPVILAMSPSIDRFVAILAMFKLKIPYVPVETSVPRNRVKIIIRETKPSCIVFDEELRALVNRNDIVAEGPLIVSFKAIEDVGKKLDELKAVEGRPDSVAVILYTSGSTGVPKGVQLTHSNIMYRLNWQWRELPFKTGEVGMAKTSLLFVDSITESWSFLLQGQPVVVVRKETINNPESLVDTLRDFNITRLLVVPSLLQALTTYLQISSRNDHLKKLKMLITSGEALPSHLAQKFFSLFPKDKLLINLYGSTEFTGDGTCDVYATLDDVKRKTTDGAMSIGKPIDNLVIKLVNEELDAVKIGEVGEIVLSGPTVMKGYVNEQHNTKAVENDADGNVWYRTGDFAKIVEEVFVYQGRQDSQVKVRGNRVNMAEIEKAIQTMSEIEKNVVLLIEDNIVAFCATNKDVTEKNVKNKCAETLPEYMVPQVYLLESIPLTPSTGKTDRVKLRELYRGKHSKKTKDTNECKTDKILSTIAKEIGLEKINANDNFYENGGNSINIIQIAGSLHELGIQVDFQRFLKARTIQEMIECTSPDQKQAPSKYRIEQIEDDESVLKASDLCAEVFANKEIVTIVCKCTKKQMFEAIKDRFFPLAVKQHASASYYRGDELVGVVLNVDRDTPLDLSNIEPEMGLLFETLHFIEAPTDDIVKDGKTLEMMVSAVREDLPAGEKLELMNDMELYTMIRAKDLGYKYIRSINTSPVTRSLARQLGWVTHHEVHLRDFVRKDGSKPFQDAPEDAIMETMIKTV